MEGLTFFMLKGCYLLFLLPTHYAIPSISMLYLLYSVGCSYYIFLWVLGRKRAGRLESNQQKRLPTHSAGPLSTDGFRRNPCEATSLARDAHPFALILHSSRGREVNGSRLRLAHFSRCASGRRLDYRCRGCITHLSVGGVSSYLFSCYFYCSGAGSFPIGSSSPRCILLSVLANRFASYLRTGPVIIAFHIVDLGGQGWRQSGAAESLLMG